MPQKKNPDVAELARGKVGRVYGNLTAMLVTMKGLPLSYNRDLQEDKEGLFDTVDTLSAVLNVFKGMIETLRVKAGKMTEALDKGYLLATDIADYLVGKGDTFRSAHAAAGKLVSWAIEKEKSFNEISIEDYKKFSPLFEDDVYLITFETSLAARDNPGGTAPGRVKKSLDEAMRALEINQGKT